MGRFERRLERPLDRGTYGASPAAAFLVDLLNLEIEKKNDGAAVMVRRIGSSISEVHAVLRDLERSAEVGTMSYRTTSALLRVLRSHHHGQWLKMTRNKEADQRIYDLLNNIIVADFKDFERRLNKFCGARSRQARLLGRLSNGLIDKYATIYDDDGVCLLEDGQRTKLTLRDFDSDKEEMTEKRWKSAKSVQR